MKVGDTFVSDGNTYKVVGSNMSGLVSEMVCHGRVEAEAKHAIIAVSEPVAEQYPEPAAEPEKRTRKPRAKKAEA